MDSENNSKNGHSDQIWTDPRFAHLVGDPRFKGIPKAHKKVKVDQRFRSMFKDQQFKVKYAVDKYGRPSNKSSTDDLKKYYDASSSDDENAQAEEKDALEASSDEDADGNNKLLVDVQLPGEIKKKLTNLEIDYARGEGNLLSDSSSDEESSGDEDDELKIEHVWGELDNDAERTDESTNRIAVCNMDWDRMRAVDIMVLCNSFLPKTGTILSVTIYPSEFGKERMAEEEANGPQELITKDGTSDEEEEENEEGDDPKNEEEEKEQSAKQIEKLREYQLNRLKYYYAVIECDSVSTADILYKECDGLEYESTANRLDLRFIPDDMIFEDEPKDQCDELPDLDKYKPRLFATSALQHANVELTWDETDLGRKEISDKLFSSKKGADLNEAELRKYVACSSDEEDSGHDAEEMVDSDAVAEKQQEKVSSIDKYKNLLNDIKKKEVDKKKTKIELEYTWGIGMQTKSEDVKKVNEEVAALKMTPFEKIVKKKQEKSKARKEEKKNRKKGLKTKTGGEPDDWSSDDMPDGVDMNDPYFAEEFVDGKFEAPKKRKSKQSAAVEESEDDEDANKQRQAELALLLEDGTADDKSHFSLKKILDAEEETTSKSKRKRKLKKSKKGDDANKPQFRDDFELNVDDARFKAVFSAPEFSIDPTDPRFKKTKAMDRLMQEKHKRNPIGDDTAVVAPNKKPRKDLEVNMLVKSIKRKVGKKI